MARKKTSGTGSSGGDDFSRAVGDSANKIWLAGLGAYERAKDEGPKMFDALVDQGRNLGGRAREAADQALKAFREGASGAGSRFDKLEQVFEDRVSRSLKRLGVLTRGEVSDLSKQVRDLTDEVRTMMKKSGRAGSGAAKRPARRKRGARKGKARATRG